MRINLEVGLLLEIASMAWIGKSMLQKSRERSRAKKYLHRNLTSGHITPNEHYLERAGLRGRKMWLCSCLIFLLFIFALAHLAVTCLILGVLQFGSTGFSYFTFSGSATTWPQGGSLSNVTIATPHGIHGFGNTPLALSAESGGETIAEAHCQQGRCGSHLSLVDSAINLRTGDTLSVRGKTGEQFLFGNSSLLQVSTLSVFGSVTTNQITTPMVSGVNTINSPQHLTLQGEGGVTARGGVVNITSGRRISLSGQSVTLNGNRGGIAMQGLGQMSANYHLCATATGNLFLVPANPQRCLRPT